MNRNPSRLPIYNLSKEIVVTSSQRSNTQECSDRMNAKGRGDILLKVELEDGPKADSRQPKAECRELKAERRIQNSNFREFNAAVRFRLSALRFQHAAVCPISYSKILMKAVCMKAEFAGGVFYLKICSCGLSHESFNVGPCKSTGVTSGAIELVYRRSE